MRMKLSFEEAVFGCKKAIHVDVTEECSECNGKGGFGEQTCDKCHGSGSITSEQHTILGSFLSKTTCPKCGGIGKTYERTCSSCHGSGSVKINKEIDIKVQLELILVQDLNYLAKVLVALMVVLMATYILNFQYQNMNILFVMKMIFM